MFQKLLHVRENAAHFKAIEHTVVEGKEHVHHGADHNIVAHHHRLFHRAAKAQDGHLRWVDDRRGPVDGEHAHVGNGEGAASLLAALELLVAGADSNIVHGVMELHKAHALGVLHNGNHEANLCRNSNRQVHGGVDGEDLAIEGSVGGGVLLEHLHRGHGQQIVNSDLAAKILLIFYQLLPIGQKLGNVHLHGGGALGHILEAIVHILGDGLADAGHLNLSDHIVRRCGGSSNGGSRGILLCFQIVQNVLGDDTAIGAGALHGGEGHALLLCHLLGKAGGPDTAGVCCGRGRCRGRSNWGGSAGVTVGFNLWDGNRRREKRNAKIEIANAELQRNQLELALKAELGNLWQAYRNNIQLLNLEKQNVVTARENHEIAKERYMLGDISGIEMREAQKSLLDAEERLISVEYQTKLCEISLLQISGNASKYLE